jgi:hypothetical protein
MSRLAAQAGNREHRFLRISAVASSSLQTVHLLCTRSIVSLAALKRLRDAGGTSQSSDGAMSTMTLDGGSCGADAVIECEPIGGGGDLVIGGSAPTTKV